MPKKYKFSWDQEPAEDDQKSKVGKELVGTAVRTGGGMLPHAVRIGSSLATIPMAKIPLVGSAVSGLTGGAGEVLAQLIENDWDPSKINRGRVAVEAGLSALPIGGEIRLGKMALKLGAATAKRAAAKGTALAGAGVVGRKATDDDPETSALDPRDYDPFWDTLQLGIGAGIGAGFHKLANRNAPDKSPSGLRVKWDRKPNDLPYDRPQTTSTPYHEDSIRNNKWDADRIEKEAAKLESLGNKEEAHGLRIAARNTDTGSTKIYQDITKAQDAASGMGPLPTIDEAIKMDPKHIEGIALRAEAMGKADYAAQLRKAAVDKGVSSTTTSRAVTRAHGKGWEQEAKNANATDKYLAGIAKETDKAILKAEKQRMQDWLQVAKNENLADDARRAQANADAVAARISELESQGATASTIVTQTSKTEGPDSTLKATTVLKAAPEEGPGGGAAPRSRKGRGPKAPATPAKTEEPPPVTPTTEPSVPPPAPVPEPTAPPAPPVIPVIDKSIDEDLLQRLRVTNPVGQQSYTPGISKPEGVILEPGRDTEGVAREGSGWLRTKFGPQGSEVADTVKPVPEHAYQGDGIIPTSRPSYTFDEQEAIKADLDNIQDPLIREMALRELSGNVPAPAAGAKPRGPRVSQAPPVDDLQTQAEMLSRPSGKAPQELLDQAAALNRRRDELMNNPAIPEADRTRLAAEIEKEANDLQIKIMLAERAAEKGITGESGQIDPELAQLLFMRVAPGVGGAAAGAAIDDEDPLRGAILGGAAGVGAPMALSRLSNTQMGEIIPDTWEAVKRSFPNVQRGALLANPHSLAINTAAPWSGAGLASIERMLTGLIERGFNQPITSALDEGVGGIRNIVNPSFFGRLPEAGRVAAQRLHGVNERGEMLFSDAPNWWDKIWSGPATLMGTGDEMSRSALMDAGWTEPVARLATVTANPRSETGEAVVNFAKKNVFTQMAQPFVKTGVNVVESAIERTPLYYFVKDNPKFAATASEIAARNGMSAAIGYIAYQLGSSVDPEQSKNMKLHKMIQNMSGQYGLIASAAFAAGQASQLGKDPGPAIISDVLLNVPLPEKQLTNDYFNTILNWSRGQPAHPNAEHLPQRWLPRGLLPSVLSDRGMEEFQKMADPIGRAFSFSF